jgi:hypothetical protein
MKVAVCYVFPSLTPRIFVPAARRFISSYQRHPPGESPHELWVLINGDPTGVAQMRLFDPLPFQFLHHDNSGKDIGAYQHAASTLACDLMVCLGSFVHFHWTGWLDRIIRSVEDNGPNLYGAWGFHQPRPHIRTTAFWLPRELLNTYPLWITNGSRYEFEHGHKSITQFVCDLKLQAMMVSRTEVLPLPHWRHLHQHECILLDQHTDRIGFNDK